MCCVEIMSREGMCCVGIVVWNRKARRESKKMERGETRIEIRVGRDVLRGNLGENVKRVCGGCCFE